MKFLTGMFAILPAAVLLVGAHGIPASQKSTTLWRTDWEMARVEAKQAGKPLFVVFR